MGGTKQGLAAFKRGVDGAFFNAYDNINECFKVLEDAIAATGANTDQKKHLKIGINTDATSWFIEDANKYEWDGPKVQYDEDQLIDFYEKILNDHPLVEYIEDAFAATHIQAYKKFQAKLRETKPGVMVASGHVLMKTDIEVIKEYTQMIQPDSEEEEEQPSDPSKAQGESGAEDSAAEKSGAESPEKAPPEKVDPKAKKDDKKGKKDAKKGKEVVEEAPKEEPMENKKPDPNANKFCPDVIRLSKPSCTLVNQFQQILNYSFTLKPEESFAIVIEDSQIDSLDAEIVDFAFGSCSVSGSGGVRYLSLSGLYRPEKSAKLQRYAEIIKHMVQQIQN